MAVVETKDRPKPLPPFSRRRELPGLTPEQERQTRWGAPLAPRPDTAKQEADR